MLLSTYCHLHGMIYIYFLVTPNTIILIIVCVYFAVVVVVLVVVL